MRTHLGCRGSVTLGPISHETEDLLEGIEATWLDFNPVPTSLVVRHVQPDHTSAPRELAGELLEFLSHMTPDERRDIVGGSLYFLDEQTGQYIRLKVWSGGFVTVCWAHPDYTKAERHRYLGQAVQVVFEPYQCLNGLVTFHAGHGVREQLQAAIERPEGLYPKGEYELTRDGDHVRLAMHDVNGSVLPLIEMLNRAAEPGTLHGQIEVTSFRPGDLDDYCRFVFEDGAVCYERPVLWSDFPDDAKETVAVGDIGSPVAA